MHAIAIQEMQQKSIVKSNLMESCTALISVVRSFSKFAMLNQNFSSAHPIYMWDTDIVNTVPAVVLARNRAKPTADTVSTTKMQIIPNQSFWLKVISHHLLSLGVSFTGMDQL